MPLYPSGMLRLKESMRSPSAAPAPSGPVNIVDPAGWGNATAGSVVADGAGNITFTAAGNGVRISEVPLVTLKTNTLYDWSATWSGVNNKVVMQYVSVSEVDGADSFITAFAIQAGTTSGQFTTPAALSSDHKLYCVRGGIGSVSGAVSALTISEH